MTLDASVAQVAGLEGYETSQHATRQALDRLGNVNVAAGMIFAGYEFSMPQVLAGASSLLGNTPLWGFSTSRTLTALGSSAHTVAVALLAGDDFRAHTHWAPGYSEDPAAAARRLALSIPQDPWLRQVIFASAEGFHGDAGKFVETIPDNIPPLVGCLAAGDARLGLSNQIGGNQAGTGGLAWLHLIGKIKIGQGWGHGWQPVGPYFKINRADEARIYLLDGQTPVETYSRWFGFSPQDWLSPPLSNLVRLYPLNIETAHQRQVLRSPLQVEVDGSFRMNAWVNDHGIAYMMTGSREACLEAARSAARQALADLQPEKAVLGIVFVDTAWEMLFESSIGLEMEAVREVLGKEVPIIGASCLGQIAGLPVQLLNQHILVCVLGETKD